MKKKILIVGGIGVATHVDMIDKAMISIDN